MKKQKPSIIISTFFFFVFSWYTSSLGGVVAGNTISTIHGLTPIEKVNIDDYVIGYENNTLVAHRVTQITSTKTNTIFNITVDQTIIHATEDQLFYNPVTNQWKEAKSLTTNDIFLNNKLEHCFCQKITTVTETKIIYQISTTSPHNFFVSDAQILTHNIPPLIIGLTWAFGAGIKFAGMTLGALVGGTMIGVNLFNKYKKNAASSNPDIEIITCSGNHMPDPNDNDDNDDLEEKKYNFLRHIKSRADKKSRSSRFGNFFRDPKTKLWWSKDNSQHAAFKVFKEAAKGLEWIFDADELGNQILAKHKGPIGIFIPYSELISC